MADFQNLTARQSKALTALLTEPTIAAAAAKVGVGERTLHTWLAEPAFASAYRDARRDAYGQAVARLQQYSHAAVTVLLQVMATTDTPAATRVNAAAKVLDFARSSIELEDLAERIDQLEQSMKGQSHE